MTVDSTELFKALKKEKGESGLPDAERGMVAGNQHFNETRRTGTDTDEAWERRPPAM